MSVMRKQISLADVFYALVSWKRGLEKVKVVAWLWINKKAPKNVSP